ncbi:MAG: pyridoxal-phosphate dependent enzyme [Sorangiineae bacterium]|nr:pyridoxal-phosphate dependent enzyme [Polyangiaceae bacterium]MEB2324252.1 pyridoxal-phosphate dependent enzyme [Sorangiineae bacterium]
MPPRLRLAHLPTPLWRSDALDALIGAEVWVKRDDMTAGAAAGNKIRKLEYLLAEAQAKRATHVITCGAVQSNHARATAVTAASLGLKSLLLLRTTRSPSAPHAPVGNLLIDRLVGAETRFITPAEYRERSALMEQAASALAATGARPYVIPEGGSNGLGALGYVECLREVRAQLELGLGGGPAPFDAVVHACGSGGTAAGVALGARRFGVAPVVHAMAVCDDRATFEASTGRIILEATRLAPSAGPLADLVIHDAWKGPAYGVPSDAQKRFIVEVARRTGLIVDPVYSGKALFALAHLEPKPARVLFIHTGGLPGLLAESELFGDALG